MKLGVPVSAMLLAAICTPTWGADSERVRGCMSPAQARDVLINEKLIAPFRALGDAARSGQGDAVGVQLCRLGDDYVYDVTVLRRDGRVLHTLIDARKGGDMRQRAGK